MASSIAIFRIISTLVAAKDYGDASLVLGVIALLSQFIVGPKVLAHMRLYFEHARTGRGPQYVIAVRKLLLVTAVWLALIYLSVSVVGLAIDRPVYWALAIPALLLLALQTQLSGTLTFLEADRRYRSLTIAQALVKLLQVPALLILLQLAISSPSAIIGAQVLAVLAVVVLWGLRPRRTGRVAEDVEFSTSEVARSASASFGWSLYAMTITGWLLTTSDRYVIDHFASSEEVGIYVVNYGLWCMPYLTLNSALELLIRSRTFQRSDAGDWRGVRKIILARIAVASVVGLLGTGLLVLVGEWVAMKIIGAAYWHGTTLMLVIAAAHLLYIVGFSYYSVFVSAKRVATMASIMALACVINVALNLVLVPRVGILGAAWSTLIAFGVLAILLLLAGQRMLAELIRGQDFKASA